MNAQAVFGDTEHARDVALIEPLLLHEQQERALGFGQPRECAFERFKLAFC